MKKIIVSIAAFHVISAMAFATGNKVALLMGNNRGEPQEIELLYAHNDIEKIKATLKTYGGFDAEDITVLLEASSLEAKDALSAINAKIQRQVQSGNPEIMLFVYFSGHADSEDLHMGDTKLPFKQLRSLVEGCPAKFRVIVLDSCKSGMLTRAKGGVPIKRFELDFQNQIESRGTALITSSAHDEDSQESDHYKGSLFTHHFNSGLLGAADESRDGKVSLFEAYAYAYAQTIKTTSTTRSGIQHPTYKYNMQGKGEINMTDLSAQRQVKSSLIFPWVGEFLVLKNDENGDVLAELISTNPGRNLMLEPGNYFVRQRKTAQYLQGLIKLDPGKEHSLTEWRSERVPYTRIVRNKAPGHDHGLQINHGPWIGYRYRTKIQDDMGSMHMFALGYPFYFDWFSFVPEIRIGRLQESSESQDITAFEFDLLLQAAVSKDISLVTFSTGIEMGCGYITTHDYTYPEDDFRQHHFGFILGGVGAVKFDLSGSFYLQLSAELLSYWIQRETLNNKSKFVIPLVFSTGLSIGTIF